MLNPGRLFLIGVLLFVGGLIGPFIFSFFTGALGAGANTQYHIAYNSFYIGVAIALCLGLPLAITGIGWRIIRRRKS
jgi:hypothetical protein